MDFGDLLVGEGSHCLDELVVVQFSQLFADILVIQDERLAEVFGLVHLKDHICGIDFLIAVAGEFDIASAGARSQRIAVQARNWARARAHVCGGVQRVARAHMRVFKWRGCGEATSWM